MYKIGQFNQLKVIAITEKYLLLGSLDQPLELPARFAPPNVKEGDLLETFIYTGTQGKLMASLAQPLATIGQVAYLRVAGTSKYGAFLDWGLPKDLLVPFSEQLDLMIQDQSYVVFVYLDPASQRIVASANLRKFIKNRAVDLQEKDKVTALVYERLNIGYQVIVNHQHWGMIYNDAIYKPVQIGDTLTAYVQKVREDQKIDLSLQQVGYKQAIDPITDQIWELLEKNDGFLPLNDKSDPEIIRQQLNMSKKRFKMAIGKLYKARRIVIETGGIRKIS